MSDTAAPRPDITRADVIAWLRSGEFNDCAEVVAAAAVLEEAAAANPVILKAREVNDAVRLARLAQLRAIQQRIRDRADQHAYHPGAGPVFFVLQAIVKELDDDITALETGA